MSSTDRQSHLDGGQRWLARVRTALGALRPWATRGLLIGLAIGFVMLVNQPPPATTFAVTRWALVISLGILGVFLAVPLGLALLTPGRTRSVGFGILLATGIAVGTSWLMLVLFIGPDWYAMP